MAQYQITLNEDLLHGLFQGDGTVARLLEEVLNQILQVQLQAAFYERTEERQGYRNGTYPRTLTTRVGRLTLRVPRIRGGEFSTELFLRYQRSGQALVLALMAMVRQGVSTRKIAHITEEPCGTEFSKSTVSALCKRLDAVVQAWNGRPLNEHRYPFVLVEALVLKVREDGRVRLRSAMIATGINNEGYREILGVMLGDSESETGWRAFFLVAQRTRSVRGGRGGLRQPQGPGEGTSGSFFGLYVAAVPNAFHAELAGCHAEIPASRGVSAGTGHFGRAGSEDRSAFAQPGSSGFGRQGSQGDAGAGGGG